MCSFFPNKGSKCRFSALAFDLKDSLDGLGSHFVGT